MVERSNKHIYYLNIAFQISERGTCLRRNYGAVIVNHDQVISTGYTGSPRDTKHCSEMGQCPRQRMNIPSGTRYDICRSVHAEMNAIISAPRMEMIGATIYVAGRDATDGHKLVEDQMGWPCNWCQRLILNAGIEEVCIYSNNLFGYLTLNRSVLLQRNAEEFERLSLMGESDAT